MGNHQHQRSAERGLFGRRRLQVKPNVVWLNYFCLPILLPSGNRNSGMVLTVKNKPVEVSPWFLRCYRRATERGLLMTPPTWEPFRRLICRGKGCVIDSCIHCFVFDGNSLHCCNNSIPSCRSAPEISMNWKFDFEPFVSAVSRTNGNLVHVSLLGFRFNTIRYEIPGWSLWFKILGRCSSALSLLFLIILLNGSVENS